MSVRRRPGARRPGTEVQRGERTLGILLDAPSWSQGKVEEARATCDKESDCLSCHSMNISAALSGPEQNAEAATPLAEWSSPRSSIAEGRLSSISPTLPPHSSTRLSHRLRTVTFSVQPRSPVQSSQTTNITVLYSPLANQNPLSSKYPCTSPLG